MLSALPVDAIRQEFDLLYRSEALYAPPLIVTAPTGSGKSTRLPLWMSASGERVLVVEPRRVACRALATYLAEQAGEPLGQRIGYSVRFDSKQSASTRVLFVTPGVALRLLSKPDLGFDAVLIDEFHERGWEVDLVAAIARRRRADGAPLKLALTSATLDAESLAEALGAELLEASGRAFPVEISHQQGAAQPSADNLPERVERAVLSALRDGAEGEILVFLPGKGEINACVRQLQRLPQGAQLVQVHASLPMAQLMRAFKAPEPGVRRVFLATNVAETSVTLPGVTWVIDSGLVRMKVHRAGKSALSLLPTSQASMDQRAGRAGRVRPGACVRLWEQGFSPEAITPPELERVELDEMVLRAAACGLEVARLEQMPWVTPPPPFAVQAARARLSALGALTASGDLTATGRACLELPVDAVSARLLLNAPSSLGATLCDLVAIMQRGARLMLPLDRLSEEERERVLEARKRLLEGTRDEVSEAITLLRQGDAKRHHLHRSSLSEARKIAASLRAQLGCSERRPERDQSALPQSEALAEHLLERAPQMGFALRERAAKRRGKPDARRRSRLEPWGNGDFELMVDPYEPLDSSAQYEPPLAAVICDHTWLGDEKGYGARGRGALLVPCSRALLARYAAAETQIGQITLQRSRGRVRVLAEVSRQLAGVTLTEQREALTGEALCVAVAQLTLENRLFKGFGELVRSRLHLLEILSQWRETLETAHWDLERLHALVGDDLDPQAWLTARVSALGVARSEDLELIEGEDLLPDLVALTALYEVELEELAERFPRVWEHQGARYGCNVSPARRLVELEPLNKAARQGKEPARNVLPRFEGYRVTYRQASRVITLRG